MDSTSQAKGVGDISTEEGRRQQVSTVEMEGKDKGKESSIVVKSLLVILAMVIVCCVVLLHLYLTERAKRPNTITEKLMENSTRRTSKRRSYFGGLCWSKECLHAASGKASTGSYGMCLPLRGMRQYLPNETLRCIPFTQLSFRKNEQNTSV